MKESLAPEAIGEVGHVTVFSIEDGGKMIMHGDCLALFDCRLDSKKLMDLGVVLEIALPLP